MPWTPQHPTAATLIDAAKRAGAFETFLAIAAATGLDATLKTPGPFTLFAPTDAAFSKFPRSTLSKLMQAPNKALLTSIVAHHFVFGKVIAELLRGKQVRASSHGGGQLLIDGADGIRVNGSRVVRPDIQAANGVLHGIDSVLWPKHAPEEDEPPLNRGGPLF